MDPMDSMDPFIDIRTRTGASEPKHFKTTLFPGRHLMLGLNCLEPGQVQAVHAHAHQDKFYYVVEGEGTFTVGERVERAGPGILVLAPAGVEHGVENTGRDRLTLLMGMAPPPSR
jgi:mannose-6-phosphate isomerase-like protein (cupin superfamily)